MLRSIKIFTIILLLGICSSCSKKESVGKETSIIVAIPFDPGSVTPLFARDPLTKSITELLYPKLAEPEFDASGSAIQYRPMLATGWEKTADNRRIVVRIKKGVQWSDGTPVTLQDVLFSYRLYTNKKVGLVDISLLKGLAVNSAGEVDVDAAIDMKDDSTLIFYFENEQSVSLAPLSMPIMCKGQCEPIPLRQLQSSPALRTPVTAGPFAVSAWENNKALVMQPNPSSTMPHPAKLKNLEFRIVAGSGDRVTMLKDGEIDVAVQLTAAEAEAFKNDGEKFVVINAARQNDKEKENFIVFNKRVGDVSTSLLGPLYRAWNWQTKF